MSVHIFSSVFVGRLNKLDLFQSQNKNTWNAGKRQSILQILAQNIPAFCMGVSKNKGTPKWMVYNGQPY